MAQDTSDVHYDPDGCLAIVGSTGEQCGASDPPLCGTHETARSVRRVDEFDEGPYEDLRDDLVAECDIRGEVAYALATIARTPILLWNRLTALEPIEVGGETWDPSKLLLKAEKVADHPDLDVDHSLFANGDCIAVVEDGQYGDEYRCVTSGHGNLLCGVHDGAQDLRTVLDADYPEGPSVDPVWIDGDKHWLIERREDDALLVTPDYELERMTDPIMTTAQGVLLVGNGWELDETDGDVCHRGIGVAVRVRTRQVGDEVKITSTKDGTRVVLARTTEADRTAALTDYLVANSPRDVDSVLAGDIEAVERESVTARPAQLAGVTETDEIAVAVDGETYHGEVVDIGTGNWQTPVDEVHLGIYMHDVARQETDGMLVLRCRRDPHGEWSDIRAEFDPGLEADNEDLGTVTTVEAGESVDPAAVAGSEGTQTAIGDGGGESEPDAPDSLPKYLREGAQKQDVSTLRDLAGYVEALAEYREAQAEQELQEQAVDETPDDWDAEEFEDAVAEAREQADIASTTGTLTTKEIDGRSYFYLQWREGSQIKSQYVAPVSPANSDTES